jgi:hypothetical protein
MDGTLQRVAAAVLHPAVPGPEREAGTKAPAAGTSCEFCPAGGGGCPVCRGQ